MGTLSWKTFSKNLPVEGRFMKGIGSQKSLFQTLVYVKYIFSWGWKEWYYLINILIILIMGKRWSQVTGDEICITDNEEYVLYHSSSQTVICRLATSWVRHTEGGD